MLQIDFASDLFLPRTLKSLNHDFWSDKIKCLKGLKSQKQPKYEGDGKIYFLYVYILFCYKVLLTLRLVQTSGPTSAQI